ncbi:MAG: bifunctional folylpolyglutamate synthase/dihydrofolate synthase [Kiritimatiellia bacterium]
MQAGPTSTTDAMVAEKLERLYARRTFGIKPGLDSIRALLSELGNPQDSVRVLHVAGTNGKGSVSKMLACILQQCFPNIGLYTSPHLVRLTERFQIDGKQMATEELAPLLEEVEAAGLRLEKAGRAAPTFFECVTALCLLWWKRRGVKLAVAEVGMGGRLDATNVLHPLVSVITRIGLDHTQFLGDTIEQIAGEKAGIVKPGVPVVIGELPPAAVRVVQEKARSEKAPLFRASERCSVVRLSSSDAEALSISATTESETYGKIRLPVSGAYQVENTATAICAIELLGERLGKPFPREAVRRGLAAVEWPGRFQCLRKDPPVFLDGGHNPDAAQAQIAALKALRLGRGVRLVVGQCADKDTVDYLRLLTSVSKKIWTVPLCNPRGMPPQELAETARRAGFREVHACASVQEGVRAALEDAAEDSAPMLICGSLFLCGEILAGGALPEPSEWIQSSNSDERIPHR